MRFSQSIVTHGTEAVKIYREISGIEHDHRLPEIFLGGWIARGLHTDFHVNARVECYFIDIMKDLGKVPDVDLRNIMGGQRADVAVYEKGRPTAIIEIKIHDEGRREGLVLRDLDKVREISKRTGIETYLAVLITDTSKNSCKVRAETLSRSLKHPFDLLGTPVQAGGGSSNWSWLFACGAFV